MLALAKNGRGKWQANCPAETGIDQFIGFG
jgi:hypothetical protein